MSKKLKRLPYSKIASRGIRSLNKLANLPPGTLYNAPRFEINGNTEIIAESCKSILEYSENIVQIDTNDLIVTFYGTDLKIQHIKTDSLIIKGRISSMEFHTK